MRVLIAGCGYVGTALGKELAAGEHVVWGLRRRPGPMPQGITPLVGDLTDASTLDAIPDSLDHVVYCVGPVERSDAAYADAYVRGLENLLRLLSRRGARIARVLLTTSTAVYAQTGGAWVDETSPTRPQSFAGRRLLEGERVLAAGPYPGVAVRLAGIYGPGRTGLLERVRDGRARCPDAPRYGNRVHRDDCAGLLAHLLAVTAPEPVYIGVDDAPEDLCVVYRWVAHQLGVAPPSVSADGDDSPRRRSNKRCSNERLKAYGYVLRFPTYRDGYASLLPSIGRRR